MNRVVLIGRLTRNPEIRYSQNENSLAVARFTLAVDRRFKRDNESTADFINCVAFGRTAEFFEKYTRQGSKMAIEGRIQTGSYVKADGTKVYTTDVVVENAEFADSKPAGQAPGQGFQGQDAWGGQANQNPQGGQGYAPNNYQGQQSSGFQGTARPAYQSQPSGNYGYDQQGYQGQAQSGFADQDFGNYNRPAPAQSGFSGQSAPMQEAADEGFMQIPDELNDEGLPFG